MGVRAETIKARVVVSVDDGMIRGGELMHVCGSKACAQRAVLQICPGGRRGRALIQIVACGDVNRLAVRV
ncbi:hypothetical protein SDC9_102289 [bioreactor metagenome]|uniref:Uncharacterized protein n=1 Tax=bioreactor metagenome TaxID=1076179 RepID=A0A645AQF2_9ZZZZ